MIDLHTHTTASDGVIEPEVLVKKAKELGLSAIAVTDHDEVRSLAKALAAGKKYAVEIIPGIEFSTYWTERNRQEFHILGYFIDFQNPDLRKKLDYFQETRIARAKKMLKLLASLGYQGEWQYLQSITQGTVGIPHIVRTCLENPTNKEKILTDFGGMPTINDFCQKYLIKGKPCYAEKAGFEPKEAVDYIHALGGVAVWAHPCFSVPLGDKEMIKIFIEWGIDGVEAIAPFRTIEATRITIEYFSKVAKENDLLITGGSDYHGIDGIGAGLGLLEWGMRIEDRILDNLKEFESRGGDPPAGGPPTRWKDG